MKHATLHIGFALLVAASAAQAAPQTPGSTDPMAGFYGNTETIDVPDGYYSARRYVDPDGTYWETTTSGPTRGRWYVEGDKVCTVQTEPAKAAPQAYCAPANQKRQAGDDWTSVDPVTGNTVFQRIEKGRPAG